MKKWPLLLLLPLSAGLYATSRSRAQAQSSSDVAGPRITSQAEFDAYTRQNPGADLDRIGHAFGNSQARLFWHTDLEAAKRQAAREGKPILALRLLGNLSDEYSCANSRFFRVLFYPHAPINERLKRDFVLFWSSERPVPVVTIDMGDGRTLKRTITGNSAHYLLDSTGRPLDAFLGLTTPQAFETWLASSKQLSQNFKAQPPAQRAGWLAKWHDAQLRTYFKAQWPKATPAFLDQRVQQAIAANPLEATTPVLSVAARAAAPLAATKVAVEGPMLGALDLRPSPETASRSTAPSILDAATRERIRTMNPLAAHSKPDVAPLKAQTQSVALSPSQQKGTAEARFETLISTFENNLRLDTFQNQNYAVSTHALFARKREGNFESLNRRIYDRLFLTPGSDQWLGLTSDTIFSALQNDGVNLPAQPETRLATTAN